MFLQKQLTLQHCTNWSLLLLWWSSLQIHHLNNSQQQWVPLRCLFHKFCIKRMFFFSFPWNMERLFWAEGKGIKRGMQNSETQKGWLHGLACKAPGSLVAYITFQTPLAWKPLEAARFLVFPASHQTPKSLISVFLTVFWLYFCFQLWTKPKNLSAKFQRKCMKKKEMSKEPWTTVSFYLSELN